MTEEWLLSNKVWETFGESLSRQSFSLRSFLRLWTCFNIPCSNSNWYSVGRHSFSPCPLIPSNIPKWYISFPLDHSEVWVSWWIFEVVEWRRGCSNELTWRLSWMVSDSQVILIHESLSVYNDSTSPYPISCSLSEHNYYLFLQVQKTISKSLSR